MTNYLGELVLALDAGLAPSVDVLAAVLWEDVLAAVNRESYVAHRARVREVLPMAVVEARAISDRSRRLLGGRR